MPNLEVVGNGRRARLLRVGPDDADDGWGFRLVLLLYRGEPGKDAARTQETWIQRPFKAEQAPKELLGKWCRRELTP